MWKPRWICVVGLLLGVCYWGEIAPLREHKRADANQAAASPADGEARELDIRYAQAYLKLIQATLEKYEEINRRVPNTIRSAVMQGIRDSEREARERIQLAQSDDVGDAQIYVSSAEADLRLAEEALGSAQGANARSPGAVSQGEIGRLKAQVEFAKARIVRARHLASESPLSNVRYELELLREDVQELQLRVSLLVSRN
jgi:hypothetical protein